MDIGPGYCKLRFTSPRLNGVLPGLVQRAGSAASLRVRCSPLFGQLLLVTTSLLPMLIYIFNSHYSISRHIERMFRIRFVLLRRTELSAFLTGLPRYRVTIDVVGIAQRKAFVLILAAPPTSQGHKSGIAAYPLLATRRLHERRRAINKSDNAHRQWVWLPSDRMSSPLLVS